MNIINPPAFIEEENYYQNSNNTPSINIYIINPPATFYNNANFQTIPSTMIKSPYYYFNTNSDFQAQMIQQQMMHQLQLQQQQAFSNFYIQPLYQSIQTSKSPYKIKLSKKKKSSKKSKATKSSKPPKSSKSAKELKKKEKRSEAPGKYKEIKCLKGIFKYFFDTYKQNPISKGIIGIEGNSLNPTWIKELPNIIDPKFKGYWLPQHVEDSYFKINFKEFSIKIDKYHVYLGNGSGMFIFKNWIIYGTTEDGRKIVLSEVLDCQDINKKNPETTIEINSKDFVQSIKFVIKGANESGSLSFDIRNIEFYGTLKQKAE